MSDDKTGNEKNNVISLMDRLPGKNKSTPAQVPAAETNEDPTYKDIIAQTDKVFVAQYVGFKKDLAEKFKGLNIDIALAKQSTGEDDKHDVEDVRGIFIPLPLSLSYAQWMLIVAEYTEDLRINDPDKLSDFFASDESDAMEYALTGVASNSVSMELADRIIGENLITEFDCFEHQHDQIQHAFPQLRITPKLMRFNTEQGQELVSPALYLSNKPGVTQDIRQTIRDYLDGKPSAEIQTIPNAANAKVRDDTNNDTQYIGAPDNSYFDLIMELEASGADYSPFDDLAQYLSSWKNSAHESLDDLAKKLGRVFARSAQVVTGMNLPLYISMPADAWESIIDDYKTHMREVDPKRFTRLKNMATQKPNYDSHINYLLLEGEEQETSVFGHHLLTGLSAYRKLQKQINTNLPELEARPSVLNIDGIVSLAVFTRCRDHANGPDIRDVINDYVDRAAKGRGHLKLVRDTPKQKPDGAI